MLVAAFYLYTWVAARSLYVLLGEQPVQQLQPVRSQYNAVRKTFSLNFALIFSLTGARRQNAKLVAFGVVTARHGAQVSPQPHYQQQQQQQQLQQYPGYGQQQQQVPWYVGDTGGGRQQGQGMPTILVQEPDQEEDPTRF